MLPERLAITIGVLCLILCPALAQAADTTTPYTALTFEQPNTTEPLSASPEFTSGFLDLSGWTCTNVTLDGTNPHSGSSCAMIGPGDATM